MIRINVLSEVFDNLLSDDRSRSKKKKRERENEDESTHCRLTGKEGRKGVSAPSI